MIRSYQAEHGGTVFYATPSRRQRAARTRLLALVVIAAVAGSASVVQAFTARPLPIEMISPAQSFH
ncbi:MAG: hypothetical protein PSX79_09495 [bacterium]|nr:hypothetical protein [bacterium]